MSLRLGDIAPNFTAKSSLGDLNFYDFLGNSWGILFSHPADYTPVCTTELGRTAALGEEFEKRGIETRPMYGCLPIDMPSFDNLKNEYKFQLPVANDVGRNTWYIGCHQYLTKEDLDYIITEW